MFCVENWELGQCFWLSCRVRLKSTEWRGIPRPPPLVSSYQIPKYLHEAVSECACAVEAETAKPHISEPHHTAFSWLLIHGARARARSLARSLWIPPQRGSVQGPDHSSPTTGSPENHSCLPKVDALWRHHICVCALMDLIKTCILCSTRFLRPTFG